jgi:hypothetical protein
MALRLMSFRENWFRKNHSSLNGVKETLPIITTFRIRFEKGNG